MDDYFLLLDSLIFILRSLAAMRLTQILKLIASIAGVILASGVITMVEHKLPDRARRIFEVGLFIIMITFVFTFRVPAPNIRNPPAEFS